MLRKRQQCLKAGILGSDYKSERSVLTSVSFRRQRPDTVELGVLKIRFDDILPCGSPEAGVLRLQSTGCSEEKMLVAGPPVSRRFPLLTMSSVPFTQLPALSLQGLSAICLSFIIMKSTVPCLVSTSQEIGTVKAKQGGVR